MSAKIPIRTSGTLSARLLAALLACSGWLGAQTQIVVHPSGFDPMSGAPVPTQIHTALLGAPSGAEILVYPHVGTGYEPFLLSQDNITIRAALVGPLNRPKVDGSLGPLAGGRCAILTGNSLINGLWFVNGNVTVSPLAPDDGGGVLIAGGSPQLLLCRVEDCQATGRGGGIFVGGGGQPVITSTEIVNNRSSQEGGGIAIEDTPTLLNAVAVWENRAQNATLTYRAGGGVFVQGASCRIEASRIFENRGTDGGGIHWAYSGGNPDLSISATEVCDNVAFDGAGGGGFFCPGTSTTGVTLLLGIDNCRFLRNRAEAGVGGGLHLEERIALSMDYCLVQDNFALGAGGGLSSDSPTSTRITNSVFELNESLLSGSGGGGGGVYLFDADLLAGLPDEFINVLFVGNRSGWTGGGVEIDRSTVLFRTCTWTQNIALDNTGAPLDGGALYVGELCDADVDTCILYGDTGAVSSLGSTEIGVAASSTATVRHSAWDVGTGAGSVAVTPALGNPFVTGAGTVSPTQANQGFYLDRDPGNIAAAACLDAGNPTLSGFPSQPPYVTATTDPAATPLPDGSAGDLADMGFHYGGTPLPPVFSLLEPTAATLSLGASVTYTLRSSASPLPGTASSSWFLGGSVTGTHPATPLGGILLPLVFDGYSQGLVGGTGLFFVSQSPFCTTPPGTGPPSGLLPVAGGEVTVDLCVPATTGMPLPVTLWHAFFVADFDSSGALLGFRHPSNPAQLTIQ